MTRLPTPTRRAILGGFGGAAGAARIAEAERRAFSAPPPPSRFQRWRSNRLVRLAGWAWLYGGLISVASSLLELRIIGGLQLVGALVILFPSEPIDPEEAWKACEPLRKKRP